MVNAGCLFISDKHVLAGYQPNKRMPTITGFGGKGKPGEEPYQTAWRETLEELFEWKTIEPCFMNYVTNLSPISSHQRNSYVQVTFSFDTLDALLKGLYSLGASSPLYDTFPTSIAELVLNRKSNINSGANSSSSFSKSSEVTVLALLPLEGQTVALHFQNDVRGVLGKPIDHLFLDD
jgi:hypothetical protein